MAFIASLTTKFFKPSIEPFDNTKKISVFKSLFSELYPYREAIQRIVKACIFQPLII